MKGGLLTTRGFLLLLKYERVKTESLLLCVEKHRKKTSTHSKDSSPHILPILFSSEVGCWFLWGWRHFVWPPRGLLCRDLKAALAAGWRSQKVSLSPSCLNSIKNKWAITPSSWFISSYCMVGEDKFLLFWVCPMHTISHLVLGRPSKVWHLKLAYKWQECFL